jgi:hypothetical protein
VSLHGVTQSSQRSGAGMNILGSLSLRGANARMNLPNPDYWLAPQRRFDSVNG